MLYCVHSLAKVRSLTCCYALIHSARAAPTTPPVPKAGKFVRGSALEQTQVDTRQTDEKAQERRIAPLLLRVFLEVCLLATALEP